MMVSGLPDHEWAAWLSSVLPYVTSWKALLVVMAVPLIAHVINRWQEHCRIKMILQTAPHGSLVASQTRKLRSSSTSIVWVGDGDKNDRNVVGQLLERWNP